MVLMEPPVAVPAQSFAAPVVITRTAQRDSGPPAVALNAAGEVAVAWVRDGRVIVQRGATPQTVFRDASGADPAAALAADGAAAVLVTRHGKRGHRFLEAATAPARAPFGRPQRLVDVVASLTGEHVFAVGGRFVAVWWQGVPGHDHAVRYAVSDAAGRFGAVQTLRRVDGSGSVSAAAGPDGSVLATFGNFDGAVAATLAPGSDRFGAPQPLAESEFSFTYAFGGPAGVAVAFHAGRRLMLAPAGAAPRPIGTVRGNGELYGPVLALRTPAVAAWALTRTANDDSDDPIAGSVEAATEQPDGSFSAPRRLTARGEFPTGVLQAAATTSHSIVLWPSGNYQRQRLRYSLDLGRTRTLATGANRGATLTTAGEHAAIAWLNGRTIRLARLP